MLENTFVGIAILKGKLLESEVEKELLIEEILVANRQLNIK